MNTNNVRDNLGRYAKQEDLIKIGDVFESNNYGKFIVTNKITEIFDETGIHPIPVGNKYFCVRFLNTGFITTATCNNILKGSIKDPLLSKISGVGYLGADIHPRSEEFETFYRSWIKMIKRCYDSREPEYYSYGAIGVKVDPRWYSFINFFNDAKFLPNYGKKVLYPETYQLDKDYLQSNIPKPLRIYSNKTCIFISGFDNRQIRNKEKAIEDGHKYFGVLPNFDRSNTYITSYSTRVTVFDNNGKSIRTIAIANFTNELAAASLYNYAYPFLTRLVPFHEINILNNICPIPYDELINHVCSRQRNDWFSFYPTYESMMNDWNTNKTYIINRK